MMAAEGDCQSDVIFDSIEISIIRVLLTESVNAEVTYPSITKSSLGSDLVKQRFTHILWISD